MNLLSEFSASPEIETVGWTLVHFIWQGFAIGAIWFVAQLRLFKHSANARYLAGCIALGFMALAPVITLLWLHRPSTPATATFSVPSEFEGTVPTLNSQPVAHSVSIGQQQARTPAKPLVKARVQNALPEIVAGWFGAVCILGLRLLIGFRQVRQIQKRGTEPMGRSWETALRSISERLSVSRPVRLCKSVLVEVPIVIGWLRPVILFPASALAGLPPVQVEAILAHELAHIRRNDYLVNLLQHVIETLLFYHPAVWWISRRVSEEREQCCDDLAIGVCGDRVVYAKALTALEAVRSESRELALAADGGSLLSRIRRILGVPSTSNRAGLWIAGTIALLTVSVLVAGTMDGLRPEDAITIRQSGTIFSSEASRDEPEPFDESSKEPVLAEPGRSIQELAPTLFERFEKARSLFEQGKRAESERLLQEVLRVDPKHRSALEYLARIRHLEQGEREQELEEKRKAKSNGKLYWEPGWPVPADRLKGPSRPLPKTPDGMSPQKQAILRKLDGLVLEKFPPHWEVGNKTLEVSLGETLMQLDREQKKRDREGRGIHFIINGQADVQSNVPDDEDLDLRNDVVIVFREQLTDVRVRDVVETISSTAKSKKDGRPVPLKYSIRDYGIVFSNGLLPEAPQLYTRLFRLDPKTFLQRVQSRVTQNLGPSGRPEGSDLFRITLGDSEDGIREGSGATKSRRANETVRQFFNDAGVDFPQKASEPQEFGSFLWSNYFGAQVSHMLRKALFYNDRTGVLFARATLEDLDRMEEIVRESNTPSRQISIEVNYVEISETDADALDLKWPSSKGNALFDDRAEQQGAQVADIISDAQLKALFESLKTRGGIDILGSPKVSTTSGRPARISVGEQKTLVFQDTEGLRVGTLTTNEVFIGPSTEILARLKPEGDSVELTVKGTLTEFLGYSDPGPFLPNTSSDEILRLARPHPNVRTRKFEGTETLPLGQTLVLAAPPVEDKVLFKSKVPILGDIPLLGKLFRRESEATRKRVLFVFVTPTLMDRFEKPVQAPTEVPK